MFYGEIGTVRQHKLSLTVYLCDTLQNDVHHSLKSFALKLCHNRHTAKNLC